MTKLIKMETVRHKRGATLRIRLPLPFAPEGWAITAQARGANIVADLAVRIIDPVAFGAPAGTVGMVELSLPANATAHWPLRLIQYDFRAERDGEVVYSATAGIIVDQEVTAA